MSDPSRGVVGSIELEVLRRRAAREGAARTAQRVKIGAAVIAGVTALLGVRYLVRGPNGAERQ